MQCYVIDHRTCSKLIGWAKSEVQMSWEEPSTVRQFPGWLQINRMQKLKASELSLMWFLACIYAKCPRLRNFVNSCPHYFKLTTHNTLFCRCAQEAWSESLSLFMLLLFCDHITKLHPVNRGTRCFWQHEWIYRVTNMLVNEIPWLIATPASTGYV